MKYLRVNVILLMLIAGSGLGASPIPVMRASRYGSSNNWPVGLRGMYNVQGDIRRWALYSYNTYDRDGFPETVLTSKQIRKYDRTGRKIAMESYGRDGELREKWREKYDEEGRLLERTNYNADGTIRYGVRYRHLPEENRIVREDANGVVLGYSKLVYDEAGNRTASYGYDPDGNLKFNDAYVYDARGRILKVQSFVRGMLNDETLFSYDEAGNITWSVFYRDSESGTLRRGSVTTTDPEGRVIMKISFDAAGRINERRSLYYREDKQIERNVLVDGSENVLEDSMAVFDEQGRVVKSVIRRADSKRITRMRYDSAGRQVETISRHSRGDVHRNRYVYNEQGQQTEMWIYDGKDRIISVTFYAYDHAGNRVSRRLYVLQSGELWTVESAHTISEDTPPSQLDVYEYEYF